MRLELTIPDQLYNQAQHAAMASGLSMETFVAEALQLHLNDDPDEAQSVKLTPDQVAIIRQSQADIKAGKGMSLDQVRAELKEHRAAWLQANPH